METANSRVSRIPFGQDDAGAAEAAPVDILFV
jgi:hypothetical protein